VFRKKKKISELKPGDFIKDVFVVKIKKDMRSYSKGFSFHLILSDASGQSIDFAYWGDHNEAEVRRLYETVSEDDVLYLSGKVGRFRGAPQISSNTEDVVSVLKEGEYDPSDFIMPSRRDQDEMCDELLDAVESVKDKDIKKLLEAVFHDETLIDAYKKHPGGIQIHHNTYGGLLEHTLETLQYCMLSVDFFDMDRDMLIAGALLHDIGKLEEMELSTRIKGTRRGQLLGHIVLGIEFLSGKMTELKTPQIIREKIIHIIASHHGRLEYGSPKEPMFPEAIAIHMADAMSSKLNEMRTFIENVKGTTDNDFAYYRRGSKNILLK